MVAKKKPQNQGEGQHCAGFKFTETAKWPRKLIWVSKTQAQVDFYSLPTTTICWTVTQLKFIKVLFFYSFICPKSNGNNSIYFHFGWTYFKIDLDNS